MKIQLSRFVNINGISLSKGCYLVYKNLLGLEVLEAFGHMKLFEDCFIFKTMYFCLEYHPMVKFFIPTQNTRVSITIKIWKINKLTSLFHNLTFRKLNMVKMSVIPSKFCKSLEVFYVVAYFPLASNYFSSETV